MDLESLWNSFAAESLATVAGYGLALALFIEAITCLLRFGLRLTSARQTAWLARYTLGYRIHHGYIGLALLLAAPITAPGALQNTLLLTGLSLLASDALHHFAVLWPITGTPEFHTRYPSR